MTDALHCRYCRCSEDDPCKLEDGDPCIINARNQVCSSSRCQRAWIAAGQAVKAERNRIRREGPFKVTKRDANNRAIKIVRRKPWRAA
jgi:hypothetical protein